MTAVIAPGQTFTYTESSTFFRRRSGAGQILGREDGYDILFVRIFAASSGELKPLIGVLPITVEAYEASRIRHTKWLPPPHGWESLRDEWRDRWLAGDAGAFSQPLRHVTRDTLETVDHLRGGGVIELAFPKRSKSGRFDMIEAFVRAPAPS